MGKLIAIEGADHIGKSSIINNVVGYMRTINNATVNTIHFPNEDNHDIQCYLQGRYPDMKPLEVAMMFARDRVQSSCVLYDSINHNDYTILDRYVLSNILYQCGMIWDSTHSPQLMHELNQNLLDYEYIINRLPEPDMTLFIKRQAVIPTDFDNDDILETNITLQNFVNDNADNIFFKDIRHGKFQLLEADYLDNQDVEELIIGAITNE